MTAEIFRVVNWIARFKSCKKSVKRRSSVVMRYLELVAGLGGRQPARRGEDTHGVRQSAAQADRKTRHGGTQRMERVADGARIAVFLVHSCAHSRVPGRAAGATIEGR